MKRSWINNGSGDCSPRGLFRITDTQKRGGQILLKGEQPSTTFSRSYGVNGSNLVVAGANATLAEGLVIPVLYDSGTPSPGETWGAKPGQHSASKGYPGLTCLGIVDATNKIMLARVEPIDHLIGKPGSTVAKGSSGSFTVWLKSSGSWAASSYAITAEALGAECTANKYAKLEWIAGYWIAGPLECPS